MTAADDDHVITRGMEHGIKGAYAHKRLMPQF